MDPTVRVNPSLMMLDSNINLQFSDGASLISTASLAESASTAQVTNQTDWATGSTDQIDQLGGGATLPTSTDPSGYNLMDTSHTYPEPLQYRPDMPGQQQLYFYNNAQIQKMIGYFAGQAQGKTGDTLTQIQLAMQPWTNAGQASSAQSSNQQGQLKNSSDTLTQQLQAVQGNLSSAVQAGNTASGLNSYGAQVIGAGTS